MSFFVYYFQHVFVVYDGENVYTYLHYKDTIDGMF